MSEATFPLPSPAASQILDKAFVCDNVFVYEPPIGNDYRLFPLYRTAGVNMIQCHPAGDGHNISQATQLIARCRREILAAPDCALVETVADIHRARANGLLAVSIQLEGFRCLERNLDMVEAYHALGVRLCHPIFNVINSIGGGCAEGADLGLTSFGRQVIAEMNRVGMVVDGAHAGRRTQLDMLEHSSTPVVFSHHGAAALRPHIRNLDDELITCCAQQGGVIGITGGGFYLGGPPSAELMFRHIDHAVQLVGPNHVGLGIDYMVDVPDLIAFMDAHAYLFPGREEGAWDPVTFTSPGVIGALVDLMLEAGYGEPAILAVLGGNWLRICEEVWK